MAYIFIGMTLSGILAKLTLLAHRGGFFLESQARKANSTVFLEILGLILGVVAVAICFVSMKWWIPLSALAIGYWVIAPLIVTRNTFGALWHIRGLFTLGTMACSIMIILQYFT